jgi:hypothetical protein
VILILIICLVLAVAVDGYAKRSNVASASLETCKGEGLAAEIRKDEKLRLTLEKVVDYLVKNNLDVKQALLDYRSAPLELMKYRSRFDYNIFGNTSYSEISEGDNSFGIGQEDVSREGGTIYFQTGVSRLYRTGTTVSVGIKERYRDEGSLNHGIAVTISQEILKNSFGIADRLNEQVLANSTEIKKRRVEYSLAMMLVDALVGFWNVAVAEESVVTAKIRYENSRDIRDLIKRKLPLGLSEKEELLDWNSKVLQNQNDYEMARKNLYDAKLAILRILNLDRKTDFEMGRTFQTTPSGTSYQAALRDALAKRVDLNNQRTRVRNSELEYCTASHNMMPSFKVNVNAEAYDKTFDNINSQWSVGLEVSYPLGNTEAVAKIQNARINWRKNLLSLEKLEKEIRDEVDSLVNQCDVLHRVYVRTQRAMKYSKTYYNQVLKKFKMGRYSTVELKLGLDNYVQMRQMALKALVDYNVALVRQDLARNVIFEKFNIDIDKILKSVE